MKRLTSSFLILVFGSLSFAQSPERLSIAPTIIEETLPRPHVLPVKLPPLDGYRTVSQLIPAKDVPTVEAVNASNGHLGAALIVNDRGTLIVDEVELDSPAERVGLQRGDAVLAVNEEKVTSIADFRERVQSSSPGEVLRLSVVRNGQTLQLTPTLALLSRPLRVDGPRLVAGFRLGNRDADANRVVSVSNDSPAQKAGLKVGDLLVTVDGKSLESGAITLSNWLAGKKPGEVLNLSIVRDDKPLDIRIPLIEEPNAERRGEGWDARRSGPWKKPVYRLAVIPIDYPDVKHNPKITPEAWAASLFSRNAYRETSATGSEVHGSLADYYHELSNGMLRVEGKVFPHVLVSKPRGYYIEATTARNTLLDETLDKLLARDGRDALKDFDGIFFLFSGASFQTNRGGLYWPHRSTMTHQRTGTRWSYFICPEGGTRMANISTICHEFGHMLGLPDLYARPENPGSEGVGVWCAMSNQLRNGRPQHFSAWCKEQLGWIKPTVIDPTIKQKVILGPIEGTKTECIKVLVKRDGSEYFLLENRCKAGFDLELPGEGLLIWRVVGNRPILEESHGVQGPPGPGSFIREVPFPSASNRAFTPYTTPSSKSQLGGGLPVYITNIRRLEDGRITFHIGYEYQ